jgi:predicted nucleotidyltransferase
VFIFRSHFLILGTIKNIVEMKKYYLLILLFFSLFLVSSTSYSQLFHVFNTEIEGMANGSLIWVDVNNDGYLDIFICGNSKFNLPVSKLYLNSCGTGFVESNFAFTPVNYGSAAWGDYDNDGDLDLLLTGYASSQGNEPISKIYRNDYPNGFTDIGVNFIEVYNGSSAWGDYDSDGDLDCIISGLNGSDLATTRIYNNCGNNIFISINSNISPVFESTHSFFDYDNDKDNDLLITGLDNTNPTDVEIVTKLYENVGGNFIEVNVGLINVYRSSVSWGDYNSDGKADILISGQIEIGNSNNTACVTRIYRNDGSDYFSNINANLENIHDGISLWGDCDNDGDLDILLSGAKKNDKTNMQPQHISLIYRNYNGVFEQNSGVQLEGLMNCSGAWGDYDNDSDLDIIIGGYDKNLNKVSKIYNNLCKRHNNLPVEPEGLTTTVDINYEIDRVDFMWQPSIDNETSQKGLTYNLRIGSTPGGCEVMSPNSILRNGIVKFPSQGNVCHNNSWIIYGLTPGRYYWSVQTVDNTFSGSRFAPEKTFVVTNSIGISKINSLIPENHFLEQNYPNPFNPKTNIRFSISKSSFVSITVYNVCGKEITTLVNEKLSAGNYEYHWNASTLSSGVYLYKIQTDDFVGVKKMILTK